MRGHAAITNGLIKTQSIRECGGIPYAPNSNYGSNEQVGQVGMSTILINAAMGVEHIADEYLVPFLDANGGIIDYGVIGGRKVISPVILER